MKRERMIKRLAKLGTPALMVMLLGNGCDALGPDFTGMDKVNIPEAWKGKGQRNDAQLAQWWKIFNDPVLNTLVSKTYAQNLDLKSAGLRILQSRAALGISEGLTYPQQQALSGNAAAVRQNDNYFRSAAVNFDLGWEMDVWGKYARGIESSEASLYASIASYDNIMVSVISEVARNYINYRTAQERIAYAKRNIVIQTRVTRMTEIQFNSGSVTELDMQQSRAQLYATRSLLPSFELSMIKARNAMAVLMGMNPDKVERMLHVGQKQSDTVNKYINTQKAYIQIKEGDKESLNVSFVPTVKFNPNNKIDAELLTNRPDVKVAEYQAHANSANIGSTMAQLYPSFSLFGNIGLNSNDATGSWISAGDALGVSAGPAFSWNIFQYDRIKNQIRIQDAIFEESLVNYNKTVLSAVSEVSDAVHGYILVKQQQKENKEAVKSTVRAFNISMTQYNDGLVSYQRLLSTVQSMTQNQDQSAQIKGSLANNVIALYKALGGGWQMNKGKAYISKEMAAKMGKRTDWGLYLDDNMTRLPQGMPNDQ